MAGTCGTIGTKVSYFATTVGYYFAPATILTLLSYINSFKNSLGNTNFSKFLIVV